jgi:hypothetical protein
LNLAPGFDELSGGGKACHASANDDDFPPGLGHRCGRSTAGKPSRGTDEEFQKCTTIPHDVSTTPIALLLANRNFVSVADARSRY